MSRRNVTWKLCYIAALICMCMPALLCSAAEPLTELTAVEGAATPAASAEAGAAEQGAAAGITADADSEPPTAGPIADAFATEAFTEASTAGLIADASATEAFTELTAAEAIAEPLAEATAAEALSEETVTEPITEANAAEALIEAAVTEPITEAPATEPGTEAPVAQFQTKAAAQLGPKAVAQPRTKAAAQTEAGSQQKSAANEANREADVDVQWVPIVHTLTYHWDTQNCLYRPVWYAPNGGLSARVTNKGAEAVRISCAYRSNVDGITGTISASIQGSGAAAQGEEFILPAHTTADLYLNLAGTLSEEWSGTIGKIDLTYTLLEAE